MAQIQDVWDPKYINRQELYLILCRFLNTIYLKYVCISHHRVQNLKFEQTLQPVLFSYSLSLSLSITSPFMALFSVESMVSGYTMLTRTTWCRTATKEGGCLNPFLVAVRLVRLSQAMFSPLFVNFTCTGHEDGLIR